MTAAAGLRRPGGRRPVGAAGDRQRRRQRQRSGGRFRAPHRRERRRAAAPRARGGHRVSAGSWVLGRLPCGPTVRVAGWLSDAVCWAWPAKRRSSGATRPRILGLPQDDRRVGRAGPGGLPQPDPLGDRGLCASRACRVTSTSALFEAPAADALHAVWEASDGLILVGLHIGNSEAAAAGLAGRGWPINVVADDTAYAALFERMVAQRSAWGVEAIPLAQHPRRLPRAAQPPDPRAPRGLGLPPRWPARPAARLLDDAPIRPGDARRSDRGHDPPVLDRPACRRDVLRGDGPPDHGRDDRARRHRARHPGDRRRPGAGHPRGARAVVRLQADVAATTRPRRRCSRSGPGRHWSFPSPCRARAGPSRVPARPRACPGRLPTRRPPRRDAPPAPSDERSRRRRAPRPARNGGPTRPRRPRPHRGRAPRPAALRGRRRAVRHRRRALVSRRTATRRSGPRQPAPRGRPARGSRRRAGPRPRRRPRPRRARAPRPGRISARRARVRRGAPGRGRRPRRPPPPRHRDARGRGRGVRRPAGRPSTPRSTSGR